MQFDLIRARLHVVESHGRAGIQPVDNERWWRFRVPGYGSVDWKGFFSVLSEAGYSGAMNIENGVNRRIGFCMDRC